MPTETFPCVDDHTAELYAMNRLNPAAAEVFEGHLLICSPCVDRVEDAQEYIAIFRAAASSIQ